MVRHVHVRNEEDHSEFEVVKCVFDLCSICTSMEQCDDVVLQYIYISLH